MDTIIIATLKQDINNINVALFLEKLMRVMKKTLRKLFKRNNLLNEGKA